jgi:hypothetical protein
MRINYILLHALFACVASVAVGAGGRAHRALPPRPAPPPHVATALLPANTLCAADEQVIFSCALKGSTKLVSLCGSKALGGDGAYLQYRFGRVNRVELEFPGERAGSAKLFRYEHEFRSRFDRTDISFESRGFSYTVFDYYNGEEKPASREAGVRVNGAGGNAKEVTMRCGGRVTANYGDLAESLTNQ